MFCAGQGLYAVYDDCSLTRAVNTRAAPVEKIGKIADFRLPRRIDKHRAPCAVAAASMMFMVAHGDDVQIDLPSGQAAPAGDLGIDQAVAYIHLGPMATKPLMCWSMGRPPDCTRRQGHLCPAEAAQQAPTR